MVLLEVCVDSRESLRTALLGGADRLEVCSRLDQGGLTPSDDLLQAALASKTPGHAMVRPRAGDFVYTPSEREALRSDLARMKALGAHGLVLGALNSAGQIDRAFVAELVALGRPLPITFHRAFDAIADKPAALETLIDLGIARVLTSGGAPDAFRGRDSLRALVEQARGRIVILAGGGVRRHNAAEIVRASGVREIHSSTVFAFPRDDFAT